MHTKTYIISDLVEARRGQTHLGTYFSTQSQARRIQALIFLLSHRLDASRHFSANFLIISDYIRLLNSTDCFGDECFALNPNNSLQIISKPLVFLSYWVSLTRTHIPLASALYNQCFQRRRAQPLFNLPLNHCIAHTILIQLIQRCSNAIVSMVQCYLKSQKNSLKIMDNLDFKVTEQRFFS